MLEEEGALGRLAAAVHALQEDEGAAGGGGGGGRRGCFGTVDDHAGGLCVYRYARVRVRGSKRFKPNLAGAPSNRKQAGIVSRKFSGIF